MITFPMTLRFRVTAADIQHGRRHDCIECPVALAVTRRLNAISDVSFDKRVSVNGAQVTLWRDPMTRFPNERRNAIWNKRIAAASVSKRMTRFIVRFDSEAWPVEPGAYQIKLYAIDPQYG